MSDKKAIRADWDKAKLELMRIRFRRVLGETVAAHVIKNTRKTIAKCVRELQKNEEKNA